KSLEQESEIKEFKEITNQYQSDTYSYDYSAYESSYDSSYGYENDSTATSPSTLSASAPQDAESPAGLPEGTVAHGSEIAVAADHAPESPPHDSSDPSPEKARPSIPAE